MDVDQLIEKFNRLDTERRTFEPTWQKVIDYVVPNKPNIYGERIDGDVSNAADVYDNTASRSANRLSATLNGMLTNQQSEWFDLVIKDLEEELQNDRDIKKYTTNVKDMLRSYLESSNFYTEIFELYKDISTIGTGVLYVDQTDDPDRLFNFSTRFIGEIYMDENSEGMVDTVARKFTMNARQVVQEFGEENVSDKVKEMCEENEYDESVTIVHFVFPREERDVTSKSPDDRKYASYWFEYDNDTVLLEDGYDAFPYIIVRWSKSSGEIYGRSPAIDNIHDIMTLNEMEYTNLLTGQKLADPPVLVPDEIFDTDFDAGGITYYDPSLMAEPKPLYLGTQLPVTIEMANAKRDAIRDGFYVTQLQLIDHRNMTASEVRIRNQENMRILGPTYGRLQFELMDPLINRCLEILFNAVNIDGDFLAPQPPPVIEGRTIRIKYLSPLARAQSLYELESIVGTINTAMQYYDITPEVVDNIDMDMAIRKIADLQGTDVTILRDPKIVNQIRQQRAQQQQAMAQMQMAKQQAEINKDQALAEDRVNEAE